MFQVGETVLWWLNLSRLADHWTSSPSLFSSRLPTFHTILHSCHWLLSFLACHHRLQRVQVCATFHWVRRPCCLETGCCWGEQKSRDFPSICTPECTIQFSWKAPQRETFFFFTLKTKCLLLHRYRTSTFQNWKEQNSMIWEKKNTAKKNK